MIYLSNSVEQLQISNFENNHHEASKKLIECFENSELTHEERKEVVLSLKIYEIEKKGASRTTV